MNSANGYVTANKKHKDRLFRLIFGSEENKENILSLYNRKMSGTKRILRSDRPDPGIQKIYRTG